MPNNSSARRGRQEKEKKKKKSKTDPKPLPMQKQVPSASRDTTLSLSSAASDKDMKNSAKRGQKETMNDSLSPLFYVASQLQRRMEHLSCEKYYERVSTCIPKMHLGQACNRQLSCGNWLRVHLTT